MLGIEDTIDDLIESGEDPIRVAGYLVNSALYAMSKSAATKRECQSAVAMMMTAIIAEAPDSELPP